MKFIKLFENFKNESVLLEFKDNIDYKLISIIQKNIPVGSEILEISCGNGADSLYLQELGYNIKCTEYDKNYVDNAVSLGLDCIEHDTRNKFPFKNNQFDLIYSRLGLHYFNEDELDNILSELKRIGNRLLITVKIEEDCFKTGKVILSSEKWYSIISKYYKIKKFDIKSGILYRKPAIWVEVLAI